MLTCLFDDRPPEKRTEVPAERLHMARQPALSEAALSMFVRGQRLCQTGAMSLPSRSKDWREVPYAHMPGSVLRQQCAICS